MSKLLMLLMTSVLRLKKGICSASKDVKSTKTKKIFFNSYRLYPIIVGLFKLLNHKIDLKTKHLLVYC